MSTIPMTRARINRVRAVPVSVPLRRPFTSALGTIERSEYGIVLVETDAGVQGLGEISLIWHGNGAHLCRDVNRLLAPALVGLDVFDLYRFRRLAEQRLQFGRHSLAAVAAVEMALLDIQGRICQQPVYRLLGGAARERVPLSMSVPIASPDTMACMAREHVAAGFGCVKVKLGGDQAHDREAVCRVRATVGPDVTVRVDANMAWSSAKQALGHIHDLAPWSVASVEQPLPPHDLAGLAFLREHSEIPIMVDESVWSPHDAWEVVRWSAADLVNVYVAESGGITAARQITDLCALAGVGVVVGSMPELAIGTSAAAHLAFSSPRLDQPSDVAGFLYHADDVATSVLRIEDGHLLAPDAPGLGVELDYEKLRHYAMAEYENLD